MPRDPKPWFRKDRDAWFVTINGRRYNLGPDRTAAFDRFHELMLTGGEGATSNAAVTVFQVFEQFLEWTKAQRAPRTYDWYRKFLEAFSDFLVTDRSALRLKPVDVHRWIAKHPKWSPSYQRDCIRGVQRSFRWAHRVGLIDRNRRGVADSRIVPQLNVTGYQGSDISRISHNTPLSEVWGVYGLHMPCLLRDRSLPAGAGDSVVIMSLHGPRRASPSR